LQLPTVGAGHRRSMQEHKVRTGRSTITGGLLSDVL
jgi:hypothetical protein